MNIEQGKSRWTDEELETLRAAIREVMGANGLSQADVAREAEVGGSTLSQFLSKKYPGDVHAVARDLARWLNTRHEAQQLASLAPPDPTFTATKNSGLVIGTLRACQLLADIGVITGPPGCGKTAAAKQYQGTTPRVAICTASPSIAGTSAILQQLIAGRGETPKRGSAAGKLELTLHVRRLFTAGWLIVMDEAQHLLTETLEELRAIHDDTGVGIVLMGNDTVLTRIQGAERSASYAQLYSRAGARAKLDPVPAADIDAVLATMSVTDKAVLQVAHAIGDKESLRVAVKAVRRAQMIAAGDRENLTANHLRLAFRQLGGTLARA